MRINNILTDAVNMATREKEMSRMAAKCLLAHLWMPVLFIESRNVGGGTGLREKVRVQFLAMWSLKCCEMAKSRC